MSLSCDPIRGSGLPLPPSCLLPLGHTAVLRCQPERLFSQIANDNYSPVFWAISFSSPSLILTCGYLCILIPVCLLSFSLFPSLTPLPLPTRCSLCASCVRRLNRESTTKTSNQSQGSYYSINVELEVRQHLDLSGLA